MEGIRGFAVFLVFLIHFSLLIKPSLVVDSFAFQIATYFSIVGNFGVDLFFVLSGYLIYGNLISKPRPFLSYISRRIQRIYPTFIVVLAAYIGLSIIFPLQSKLPVSLWSSIILIIQNLLLLPGLFHINRIVPVSWSLSYEMFYYLTIPVLIQVLRLRTISRMRRIVIFIIIAIAMVGYNYFYLLHIRLVMFLIGIILYESSHLHSKPVHDKGLGIIILIVGISLAFICLNYGKTMYYLKYGGVTTELYKDNVLSFVILCVTFYMLCWYSFLARQVSYRIFTWTPIRWFGNMSYSYFLIHGLALSLLFAGFEKLRLTHEFATMIFWLILPIFFVITLVPSTVLFVLVERPYSLKPPKLKSTSVTEIAAV